MSKKYVLVVLQNLDEGVQNDVKELMKTAYTIDQEVEYVYSWDDMKAKMAASPGKYAVINVAYYKSWANVTGQVIYKGNVYAVGAMIPGKKDKMEWVIPLLSPIGHTRFHITYALHAISKYMPAFAQGQAPWDVNADVARLKKKTLLIVEGALDDKTSLADAKAAYGGKVEVVPASRIVEVVNARDPNYAVLVNEISSRNATPAYSIVDVETYDLLATLAIGGVVLAIAAPGPTDPITHKREQFELASWRVSSTDVNAKRLTMLSDAKTQSKYRKY